jgi:hypothetical protein
MKEVKDNLIDCILKEDIDAICITTSGNYTRQGLAVITDKASTEVQKKYPKIQNNLGRYLKIMGHNVPYIIGAVNRQGEYFDVTAQDIKVKNFKCLIISLPTKNHIKEEISLPLLKQSFKFLIEMCDKHNLKNICLPKLEIGLDSIKDENLKSEIESLLDNKFLIVSKE